VQEFLNVLNGRINSLANAHALLSRSRWEGVGLGELVRSELAFCAKDETALIEGPKVDLAAMATQTLAMVLHELTTNAAKYGALSNGHGRVMVCWRRQSRGPSRGKLVLEWRETGGPPRCLGMMRFSQASEIAEQNAPAGARSGGLIFYVGVRFNRVGE
jgi:two-component sensor histidine kinase